MDNKILIIMTILILIVFLYKTQELHNKINTKYDNKIEYLKEMIKLSEGEIKKNQKLDIFNKIKQRDERVINDPLYPPYNRMNTSNTTDYLRMVNSGIINNYDLKNNDTYRIIAYLVNTVDKNDVWQLFGREKYARSNIGDFYIVSINKNSNDNNIKLPLTDEIMTGKEKIKHIYSLPKYVSFKSSLLSNSPYEIIELKNSSKMFPYF